MDEELMNVTTEENVEVKGVEIIETEVPVEDEEYDVSAEEVVETVEVETTEEVIIEVDEAIGWAGGDSDKHYSLLGRDDPNQHSITAITSLREELDEIERLKTVHSDSFNVANYYKWNDASYDEYGYFVSLVSDTSKIKICDGSDIFGVSVDTAGFVGGQDADVKRDNSYGLIATSGLVDVRCELDVEVGDYVISNARGYAKKSDSDYGYKVLAKEEKAGVEYVVIALGVQADITNAIGEDLMQAQKAISINEKNIVSAINLANQAYQKSTDATSISEEAIKKALEAVLNSEEAISDVENINKLLESTSSVAAQAKAIAESAATSAENMRNEAIESANGTAAQIKDLTKTIEPLTTWVDPNTGNSGASYLVNYIDNGLATKAEVETVEDGLEYTTSAIQQNAKTLQSLVVSIDKYSVGEYSQANGLTLEQATSILELGMIYVPTEKHTETYKYDSESEYIREFTPGFLYQWSVLSNGQYGWITVDKNYNETSETNVSSMAVYFTTTEPIVSGNFGYWYTDGDTVDGTYEPYALYKWEEDHWLAVATLNGNVNNRAISQIRQTANEIALEVTDARGSVASLTERLTDTEAEVQSLTAWSRGGEVNEAIIRQESDNEGASVVISAYKRKSDGTVEKETSLVLSSNNDGSALCIDADRVNFTATADYSVLADNITLKADQLDFGGGDTEAIKISANNIDFEGDTTFVRPEDLGDDGTTVISGDRITTGSIRSNEYNIGDDDDIANHYATQGMSINLDTGVVKSKNFGIDINGNAYFNGIIETLRVNAGSLDANNVTITNLSADSITTGTMSADRINGMSVVGNSISINRGSFGGFSFSDTQISGDSIGAGSMYIDISANNDWIHIDDETGKALFLIDINGNMYSTSCNNTLSDRNFKYSIENFQDNYEDVFDNLNPIRYKYNDGTSDRYHTGFIAQDMATAVEKSGLTLQDFAAVCVEQKDTENERWSIRYGELVSLNTWQIQKLKARVNELEQKNTELEERLAKIEALLNAN